MLRPSLPASPAVACARCGPAVSTDETRKISESSARPVRPRAIVPSRPLLGERRLRHGVGMLYIHGRELVQHDAFARPDDTRGVYDDWCSCGCDMQHARDRFPVPASSAQDAGLSDDHLKPLPGTSPLLGLHPQHPKHRLGLVREAVDARGAVRRALHTFELTPLAPGLKDLLGDDAPNSSARTPAMPAPQASFRNAQSSSRSMARSFEGSVVRGDGRGIQSSDS
jgi:hypothetical protein